MYMLKRSPTSVYAQPYTNLRSSSGSYCYVPYTLTASVKVLVLQIGC